MFSRLVSSALRREGMKGSSVPLHFTTVPTKSSSRPQLPPVVMLHGVLASESTYRSIMSREDFVSNRQKIAIDLRNHGKSPHVAPEAGMSYDDMAGDITAFLDDQEIEKICVIGHSMGGKVAMQLALTLPERVSELVVVDIAPSTYESTNAPGDTFNAIAAMRSVDLTQMETRADVDSELERMGVGSSDVRQFVLTNLVSGGGSPSGTKYQWKVNVESIHAGFRDILAFPDHSGKRYTGPTCLIRGGNSKYVPFESMRNFIGLFPNTKLVTIADAGHWLQAQMPDEFCRSVNDFLKTK